MGRHRVINFKNLRLPAFSQKNFYGGSGLLIHLVRYLVPVCKLGKSSHLVSVHTRHDDGKIKTYFTGIFILYWHYHK